MEVSRDPLGEGFLAARKKSLATKVAVCSSATEYILYTRPRLSLGSAPTVEAKRDCVTLEFRVAARKMRGRTREASRYVGHIFSQIQGVKSHSRARKIGSERLLCEKPKMALAKKKAQLPQNPRLRFLSFLPPSHPPSHLKSIVWQAY